MQRFPGYYALSKYTSGNYYSLWECVGGIYVRADLYAAYFRKSSKSRYAILSPVPHLTTLSQCAKGNYYFEINTTHKYSKVSSFEEFQIHPHSCEIMSWSIVNISHRSFSETPFELHFTVFCVHRDLISINGCPKDVAPYSISNRKILVRYAGNWTHFQWKSNKLLPGCLVKVWKPGAF